MVEFKANIDIEGLGVNPVSVGDNCFCAFVEEKEEGEEADKECCFDCCFNMCEGSVGTFRYGGQGCNDWVGQ